MTRIEFAEMVEYITDRFGLAAMDSWEAAPRIYSDFETLDGEVVWAALLAKLDSNPNAEFPPKPPAVRAAALDRLRHSHPKALPESTESYGWAEFSQRNYGRYIPLAEVVQANDE